MLWLHCIFHLFAQGPFAGVRRDEFAAYFCGVVHEECETAVTASFGRQLSSRLQTPSSPTTLTPGELVRRNSSSSFAVSALEPAPRNPQPARRIQPTALASEALTSGAPRQDLAPSASAGPPRASSAVLASAPRPADTLDERETLKDRKSVV